MTPASCARAVLVLVLVLATTAGRAGAQSAEAEALFREGRRLIKSGALAAGCDKLEASARLELAVGTLLNLGDCREKLGKPASAWAAFRKAEAMARRAGGDAKREAEARKRAAQLEPRLSNLVVNVPRRVDGMTVRRDGTPIDAAAWSSPVPVDPGRYTIIVEAPGYLTWRREVRVPPGTRHSVVTVPVLERAPEPPVTPAPPPPMLAQAPPAPPPPIVERGTWSATRKLAVVVGVIGAGGVGAGGYFALRARELQSQSDERCPQIACDDAGALRLNERARDAALRANIGLAAGGVAVAAAAVMWFAGTPGDTIVAPSARRGELGMTLAGTF